VAIRFYCDQCGQKIKAQDDMVGMRIACPTCRDPQTVPQPASGSRTNSTARADAQALKMAQHFDPTDFNTSSSGYQKRPNQLNTDDDKSIPVNQVKSVRTWRGSLYFVFLLGLIPLVMSMMSGQDESILKQLEHAINTELKGDKQRKARNALDLAKKGEAGLDDILGYFPNKKIKSAWFSRDTDKHYYLAMVCTVGFVLVTCVCLPKGFARLPLMLIIGVFTGVFGIGMLLIFQLIAASGFVIILGPFAFIALLIGIAYRSLMDPDISFLQTLASYTFGVGLCEEIIKALPIFFVFLGRTRLRWHECFAMGMASGVGFGIAEGIHYSGMMYNGLVDMNMYLVRFISCVTLHGIWSAASALFLHRYQRLTHGNLTVMKAFYRMFILISIPMVLHGLYDTFLSKDMESLALTVAVFSFGWLVIMVESAREKEGDMLIKVSNVINEGTPLHGQAELHQPVPDSAEGPAHAVSPSPL
jgi:RsiW-degrading membrane proteinase PrsW (M82 family)